MDLGLPVHGSESGPEIEAPTRSKPGSGSGEDGWRGSKLARTEDSSVFKTLSFHQGVPLVRSGPPEARRQENMLSFSSDKSEAFGFVKDGGLEQRSAIFPCIQQISSPFSKNAGVRGPFTLSQWVELELQALIYKYITANVPVPSSLLLSLKKSCYPYGLSSTYPGSLPPSSLGWGFHLGFSGGSTDPEPGRCRRTDGKKWRCSRDAVPDQKYCERHINRGRHRSRKPVEGHTGQAAATKSAASTGSAVSKVVAPVMLASSMSTMISSSMVVAGGSGLQDSLAAGGSTANPSADSLTNRVQNRHGQSKETPTVSTESSFDVGLVSSDSLHNPSHKNPYVDSTKNYGFYFDFNDQETQTQNSPSDSAIAWAEELTLDRTQHSMSIPMPSSEFSSSFSSHVEDKLALLPLRLSHQFEPVTQMGLGLNTEICEPVKKLNNWVPISWGNSIGGPLGEALTSTTNSPRLGSSPTGVLQKPSFGSLSNSSSGSSPVGENKKGSDGVGLCDDLLGFPLVSSVPSL